MQARAAVMQRLGSVGQLRPTYLAGLRHKTKIESETKRRHFIILQTVDGVQQQPSEVSALLAHLYFWVC